MMLQRQQAATRERQTNSANGIKEEEEKAN